MSRPPDWAPLAGADPLAGDPEEIATEAGRLNAMAAEMAWQVRTLKGMGADTHLAGDYAVALRTSATDVAAKLEKVIHRYSEAARCLSAWAPELEEFQRTTFNLLLRAQEVERTAGRDIHSDLVTPGLAAYQQFHATGAGDAPPELALLSRELEKVLEEAEARGRFWAHQIAEAIDDELTDGFWDHIHGWVENHKEQLEKYTSRLGWVATVAAIAALAVPGLNVAVLGVGLLDVVVVGSGATLLATHGVMAAEGQGSWWEAGVDAVGLASFGYGRFVLGKSLGRAAEVTKEAGAEATGQEAAQRFITQTREEAMQTFANKSATATAKFDAGQSLYTLDGDAAQVGYNAAQAAREAPESEAGLFQRLAAGSKEDANALEGANRAVAEHPGNQAVEGAAAEVRRIAAKGQKNWAFAAGLDGSDKTLNTYWAGSYRDFKEKALFTHGIGWLQ